jgi:preprotein translocase subunit SecB
MRLLVAKPEHAAPKAAPHQLHNARKGLTMADQDSPNQGNGSGEGDNEAQVATIAQYIKDLSVENPSAPQVFQWQTQPTLDVQFNLNAEKVADDVHEVGLKIEVTARSDNGVHFVVDLSYAGLFGLHNVPEEALAPILLVEAPRMLFPFARQIIAEAVTNTGFPPLLLDPIDFTAAYMAQLQAAQQQAGGNEPAAPAEETPPETPSEG